MSQSSLPAAALVVASGLLLFAAACAPGAAADVVDAGASTADAGDAGDAGDASDAGVDAGEADAGEADAGALEPDAGPVSCGAPSTWRCAGGGRERCGDDGMLAHETCAGGCRDDADGDGQALCTTDDPTWPCASSSYQGAQYWTCSGGAVHACVDGEPQQVGCEAGCVVGALGTDDVCRVPGQTPPVPALVIDVEGGLFSESDVRPLLEEGLAYEFQRLYDLVDVPAARSAPATITLTFSPSSDPFCSGLAHQASAEIACPYDYPISGDNQNFVVNIAIHEMGHVLAQALIGPPSARDNCENEGVATWIAGRYWMNFASTFVGSFQAAAEQTVASGTASASMTTCVLASDPWYKVYGSFFEYLEQNVPGGVMAVGSGAVPSSVYEGDWQDWL